MNKLEDFYMRIWCVIMPVMGTVLIPSVQGTIPAYMMAFGSLIFVVLRLRNGEISGDTLRYFKTLGLVFLAWFFLMAASQVNLMISGRSDFMGVNLVEPEILNIMFRPAIFTQSLYLFACVLIGLYFRYFFQEHWMRYVIWGGYLLAIYGIYEWLFFLIFHHPGDFLVNRVYGEPRHLASWSQGITFGGIYLLRIKSTLGEPTFFTAACLPFLFLALDYRKRWLTGMLIFCALFSTSTACYICITICLCIKSVWQRSINFRYLTLLLLVIAFLGAMYLLFPENFNGVFLDKLSGNNDSGRERLESAEGVKALLLSFDLGNWLFGIGFGYAYLSVFTGLLVNTGLVGLAIYCYVIFRPAIYLPIRPESEGLKMSMIVLIILSMLSLSELFIPTSWMFLALANRRLALLKQENVAPQPVAQERLRPAEIQA